MNVRVIGICTGLILLSSLALQAQQPEIIGYNTDGELRFTSGGSGEQFTLEFTSDLVAGVWTNWGSVTDAPITGQVMSVQTPMYFRIREHHQQPRRSIEPWLISEGYDINGDGYVSSNEAATLEVANIYRMGFSQVDLRGMANMEKCSIERCPNLRNVLAPELPELTLMTVNYGDIRNIDVQGCAKLTELVAESTTGLLTNVNVTGCIALQELNLRGNSLGRIDVSSCTNLVFCRLESNPITEIVVWDVGDIDWLSYDGYPWIHEPLP